MIKDKTNVVSAKAERPSGAGLANFRLGALDKVSTSWSARIRLVFYSRIETGLEISTERREAMVFMGTPVGERIATYEYVQNRVVNVI